MNKAIGYIRISTKDQSNFSLDGQEKYIRDYCDKNKIECLTVFKDDGRSAKNFDRPDWRSLEKFLQANINQVQILIVAKYDRFSRNVSEALQMIELLESKFQVRILSVMEPINLHPQSPYFFQFRTTMLLGAQVEWLVIKDRTRAGIRQANVSGRVVNKAPIGYINKRDDRNKPIIVVDAERSIFIKRVFQLYLQGMPPKAIGNELRCKEFNLQGNGAITRILINPLYGGLVKAKAHYDDPEQLCKGIHEPIIDEATWWKVQTLINNRTPQKNLIYNDNFPLKGILEHDCGKRVTAAFSQGKKRKFGYYRCMADNTNLNAGKLHGQMEDILKELSLPSFFVEYIQQGLLKKVEAGISDRRLQGAKKKQQLMWLYTKLNNIEEDRNSRQIDAAYYTKWHNTYRSEIAILEADIAAIATPINETMKRYRETLPLLQDMHFVYQACSTPQKQFLLRGVFERGLMHDGDTFRTPWILPVFAPKAAVLAQKRLLVIEQPAINSEETVDCSPYETIIEPLFKLLDFISTLKIA